VSQEIGSFIPLEADGRSFASTSGETDMSLHRLLLGSALLSASLVLAAPSFAETLFRLDASAPGEADPDKGIDYVGSCSRSTSMTRCGAGPERDAGRAAPRHGLEGRRQ